MTESPRLAAARALLVAALQSAGIRFSDADVDRLAAEFADHVDDGRALADAADPASEPWPTAPGE
jgi:hypothetical protein